MRAIPERLRDVSCIGDIQIYITLQVPNMLKHFSLHVDPFRYELLAHFIGVWHFWKVSPERPAICRQKWSTSKTTEDQLIYGLVVSYSVSFSRTQLIVRGLLSISTYRQYRYFIGATFADTVFFSSKSTKTKVTFNGNKVIFAIMTTTTTKFVSFHQNDWSRRRKLTNFRQRDENYITKNTSDEWRHELGTHTHGDSASTLRK